MSIEAKHIHVCICTFRRPQLLTKLLQELEQQGTNGAFTFSVAVVDNDENETARPRVSDFASKSGLDVTYCVEPVQNIALARNKALETARGDFIAFIDDDEHPTAEWLLGLFKTAETHQADAVLGPVRPHFEEPPPDWIIKGRFCERPEYETGRRMKWTEGRTGNILIRRASLEKSKLTFDPKFGNGGEDMEFLRQAADHGWVLVWCNEAAVHEAVPPVRLTRSYMLKRALLRGKNILKHPTGRARLLSISAVAVPLYSVALPVLLLAGHHLFMKGCIKLFDHLGRLLAVVGMNPVRERDV